MKDPMFQKVRDTVRAGLPPGTDVIFYYNKHVALYQMKIKVMTPCPWSSYPENSNIIEEFHKIGAKCYFDFRHRSNNVKFIIVVEWRPK